MRITYADIEIRNPVRPDLKPIRASALADTGALHLCIPRHIALQLTLDAQEEREVTLADGSRSLVPYVGPIGCVLRTVSALSARWSWATRFCSAPSRWRIWIWSSYR